MYLFIYLLPRFQNCVPKYHDGPYKLKNKPHVVSKGAFDIFVLGTKKYFYRILEENMSKIKDNNIKVNYYRVWMRNISLINMVKLG